MKLGQSISIATIIVARNESKVIQKSVKRVIDNLGTNDALYVIADNCTDKTAVLAKKEGAEVYERFEENSNSKSKGEALSWFVMEQIAILQAYDYLLVLDADTIIDDNLFEEIKHNIPEQCKAGQCHIEPLIIEDSPIANMAALSYFLDQKVLDRIRSHLGCSVRLRGTGMLIRPELLFEISNKIACNVEDIALSLLISVSGNKIERIEEAIVFDPIPGTPATASYQRARWYRGQWNAIWKFRREVIQLIFRGPCGWSLLESLFMKPKIIYMLICLLLAMMLSKWLWISLLMWSQVALGFIYLLIGFYLHPNRKKYIVSLAQFPIYLFMWVKSIWLSTTSSRWFKAR